MWHIEIALMKVKKKLPPALKKPLTEKNPATNSASSNKMQFTLVVCMTLCLLNSQADGTAYNYRPDPPPHTDGVAMARYTLHQADWATVATISTLPGIEGYPFSNVQSIADGNDETSTGIPYFYMSPLDFTPKDLSKNKHSTVVVSLELTGYCESRRLDTEDPRCTRLMLTGSIEKIEEGTDDYKFAKAALFDRHTAMVLWPTGNGSHPDHHWFVAQLKITHITLLDFYGPPKFINVGKYLAYNYTQLAK